MPIGKNAIKRVSNNGYSNVKSEAPDMENSVVAKPEKPAEKKSTAAKKAPAKKPAATKSAPKNSEAPKKTATKKTDETAKKTESATKKTAPKATAEKKSAPKASPVKKSAPKKSMESEPELKPVRTLEKITEKSEERESGYVNFGRELPIYLL